MTDRQFLWGLANGVIALALGGAFWVGLGIGMFANRLGGPVLGALTVVQVGGCVALIWGAVRLRRRSGFRRSELHVATGAARAEARHIVTMLRWTMLFQLLVSAVAVGWLVRAGAEPLIWPVVGLVVSLHFAPLARLFHVRIYYLTAAAGAATCVAAIAMRREPHAFLVLVTGMALVMWGSGSYILVNSERIAARAIGEVWAG